MFLKLYKTKKLSSLCILFCLLSSSFLPPNDWEWDYPEDFNPEVILKGDTTPVQMKRLISKWYIQDQLVTSRDETRAQCLAHCWGLVGSSLGHLLPLTTWDTYFLFLSYVAKHYYIWNLGIGSVLNYCESPLIYS